MGLFDTLWGLGDIAKDIISLPFQISKAATELGEDIKEAVVQDVRHKIGGAPNKPIRTSYDVKTEAESLISASRDEYWEVKEKFIKQWELMVKKSEKLKKVRIDTYSLIGQTVRSKQLVPLPASHTLCQYPPAIPSIDYLRFDAGTYLGNSSMRMEAAEEYLGKAKNYRIQVKAKINEINRLKRLVMRAKSFQIEELEMLSIIQKSYKNQGEVSLLQSAELLQELAALCAGEVCDKTNESYEKMLQQLKSIWL